MNIKNIINKLAVPIYRHIFKEEMSPAVNEFVHNLSWVGAGTFIATGLIAIFSILGGRLLGPEEYGKFTLIQSVAMFLNIPMIMGFNMAMLKYNAEKGELPRQKSIISTTYIIIAGLTAVSAVLMIIFSQPLANIFSTTPELFRFSIGFAVLFTSFTLAKTTLRSINRMRVFAMFEPVHAFMLLTTFLLFIFYGRLTFKAMIIPMLLAYVVTSAVIHFKYTRQYLSFSFDSTWGRTLSRFALASLIAGIASALYGNIGKIIIARYMTVADVGIYAAYIAATMSTASVIWGIFNMVFFPTASKYKNKQPIFRRINRLVPLLVILGIPFIMGTGYIVLQFYGDEYPLNILWLALFASAAILMIIHGFYSYLLVSVGPKGALINSLGAVTIAVVSFAINLLFVPLIGINGAVVAIIAAYIIGLYIILLMGRRLIG